MSKNKLRQNYNAIKSLPLVKQLIRENENLKLEKKALLLLLKSTTPDCCKSSCCKQHDSYEETPLLDIVIKKENVELDNDEIEIITSDNNENIVYEIYEDSDQNDETKWKQQLKKDAKLNSDWDNKETIDNNPNDKKIVNLNPDNMESEDEGEFTCNDCHVTKPHNWCYICTRDNICETCEGEGGDYGDNEDWICGICLSKHTQLEESEPEDEIDKCEICENKIDMDSDDVIELIRETEQVKETFILCIDCFEERSDDLRKELWNVDDYLEDEAETSEEVEKSEDEAEASDDEEEEVFEIEINGTLYYTTNEKNGDIYEVLEDEDIGDKVGKFVNKVAKFN